MLFSSPLKCTLLRMAHVHMCYLKSKCFLCKYNKFCLLTFLGSRPAIRHCPDSYTVRRMYHWDVSCLWSHPRWINHVLCWWKPRNELLCFDLGGLRLVGLSIRLVPVFFSLHLFPLFWRVEDSSRRGSQQSLISSVISEEQVINMFWIITFNRRFK